MDESQTVGANVSERVDELLALPDPEAQRQFWQERLSGLEAAAREAVVGRLKQEAEHLLRTDIQRCLQTADLMLHIAGQTGSPAARALGLLAEANARGIGLGEYQEAVSLYDEAAAIYADEGQAAEEARAQIGKLWPLSQLGRYQEALRCGEWAAAVLETHGQWEHLAKLSSNLAIIYFRLGEDERALELFERAQALHERIGGRESPGWLRAEQNRAIVLRNLGRFDASIAASRRARERLQHAGQRMEAARAQQNLAITYFVLGRYNEALELLDAVRDTFLDDGRHRDALLAELFISDCLLQLRRFRDVLEKCRNVRAWFGELGAHFEVGQALVNEAVAYAGLEEYAAAMASLEEARALFVQIGNATWVATADLEKATVLLHQQEHGACLAEAEACAAVFRKQGVPVAEAQANLVAARAAAALGQKETARRLLQRARAFAEEQDVPTLLYQSHYLLGRLRQKDAMSPAALEGASSPAGLEEASSLVALEEALEGYEQAIFHLERLQGRLMVEFRADFLQDKEAVYRDAVSLSLDLGRPEQGLAYAERAKSRALLDLLAFRLDLGLEAREPADETLISELVALRAERDRLYRRWESGEGTGERGAAALGDQAQAQQEVVALERRITDLWHRLLIRNADYARDAALWQVRTESAQPYLDEDTLLLEYYVARDELALFLVTAGAVDAVRLADPMGRVQQLLQLLWLNLKAAPGADGRRLERLEANARGLLCRLYDLLLAPVADRVAAYGRLIIVPHGALHYLPFHALHDGRRYLLEQVEVSYLPGASFLPYCRNAQRAPAGLLALGHTVQGRLSHTLREARTIASRWQGEALLEEDATRARLRERAPEQRVLHLATHGDFRPDNPLFSGLVLADGWLTTLDIFNLRLRASLVTLSACQTGRSVVGGGDELLGLMRAFLSAGAASLALSLWAVEDRATAEIMEAFYEALAAGRNKGGALRQAQRDFLEAARAERQTAGASRTHPYFWAPFFLVGDAGAL